MTLSGFVDYDMSFLLLMRFVICRSCFFFFQAEDGIRDLVRSRGLGDVYKRQGRKCAITRTAIMKLVVVNARSSPLVNLGMSRPVKLSLIHI